VYDTKTAELLAEYDNELSRSDFRNLSESLYKTKNGAYFLAGEGGAHTKYAEACGNYTSGSSKITPLTKEEALEWCEQYAKTSVIEKEFSDVLEEA
jgi:hypothetical protein